MAMRLFHRFRSARLDEFDHGPIIPLKEKKTSVLERQNSFILSEFGVCCKRKMGGIDDDDDDFVKTSETMVLIVGASGRTPIIGRVQLAPTCKARSRWTFYETIKDRGRPAPTGLPGGWGLIQQGARG